MQERKEIRENRSRGRIRFRKGEFMKQRLHVILTGLLICGAWVVPAWGQEQGSKPAEVKAAEVKPTAESAAAKEESSTTQHSARIGGAIIAYTATASTTLLKNDKGEPTALIYSTAYTRNDVKDLSRRPITFIYNGGPGSSSVWLHMGAWGPRRVITADPHSTPPAPYKVVDNEYSLLDASDLVFVDPVGTGFSHAAGKAQDKDFWGVEEDVKSLAQFITRYASRNGRWNSPKYLLGESYGTFRSAALVDYLQSHEHMDFNGVVLMSSVLDFDTILFPQGADLPYVLILPSYAAVAAYYGALPNAPANMNVFLDEVRLFARTDYATALMQGDNLSSAQRDAIVKKLAAYTGLSEEYIRKADLRVSSPQFRAELLRGRDLNTGRLDARYSGPMLDMLTEYAEGDPQSQAVSGAFTAAFNDYLHSELKFGQDMRYEILGGKAASAWNWKRGEGEQGTTTAPNVEGDLQEALAANPFLQVQIENGLYDLATPFFATEYTVDHLGLPESVRGHVHMEYYNAGHMMYLQEESLARLKANVAKFISSTSHP
jgi:carboxypeptidase C (cathepsin A)